ncbi:hypothetical protein ACWCSD_18570 [Nonomuraea sp. NPDC001684]
MMRISPYPVVIGDVSLEVREARLDDFPLPYNMISKSQRVVALNQIERSDWTTARLGVRVRTPEHELNSGPWFRIECLTVLSERRTNVRLAIPLMMGSNGEWSGEVELRHDQHVGRPELSAHLVATVDGVPGRLIATAGDPWTIDLRAQTPTQRDEITVRWLDFADERNPHLHHLKYDPWTVETAGDEPALYLNSGFEGLKAMLEERSSKGAAREAREALAAQITMSMWSALFNTAVQRTNDNGSEWPTGWHGAVLRRMVPDLFPDIAPDDALAEVAYRYRTDGGDLQARVMHAAAKQARMPRNLGSLIRALRNTLQENE